MARAHLYARSRIKSLDKLKRIVNDLKMRGKRIVFTNGCFELLHIGHERCLQEAKSLGDVLIVGVNSDNSVRKLKGTGRPVVPEMERAEIVASLRCVDYVTVFPELTPRRLISVLKPDTHVKGGDYELNELPEAEVVKSYGGKVVTVNKVEGCSTTKLIQRILRKCKRKKLGGTDSARS